MKDYMDAATRIRELEAEIERLRAAQQWRPIEEAPRDGTYILLEFIFGDKTRTTLMVKWNGLGWDTGGWMAGDEQSIGRWLPVPPLPEPPK